MKKRSKQRPRKEGNPDLRRQRQTPALEIPQLVEELKEYLTPCLFTPLKYVQGNHEKLMRERLLTLPVMVALVVSLVYRKIPGLSEAVRVLQEEGLLWVKPLKVSKQAVSKRLINFPTEIFAVLLKRVLEKRKEIATEIPLEKHWETVREKFSALWIADGSTLEQLRKRLKIAPKESGELAGKMMVIVEALTQVPVTMWYEENPRCNDKIWCQELLEALPQSGLLIFDLGFFCFGWFDQFTQENKFFLTRMRAKTAYQSQRVLSSGTYYRDEIIHLGKYRSNPCHHPVRLVSVLWGKTWYYYLTNVLDDEQLSPQEVCDLYRRRWKIEEAFSLTKRLLGLAYLWVGHANGVQIQILATLIFYTILNQLVGSVAIALRQPKEKISVEMVFRSLYYVAKAALRGENPDVVPYLAERAKLFGLVKAERKRHREKDAISQQIWASVPLS
ncbi:MAG: IS4 family transposase [Cyanobacteria bacterium SBLK]|nr:IS4 family transposase [Cyanobacteria bacterium SBLK]